MIHIHQLSIVKRVLKMGNNIEPEHYTSMAISPLEYIVANDIAWREGNCIKYISRYKMKNGIEDLKKARYYLDHLIKELES